MRLFRRPECVFFASKLYVLKTIVELHFEFSTCDVFLCFAGFLWADLLRILKTPEKLLWVRLRERTFAFVGKLLENLESREFLSVHRLKLLTVLTGPWYKTLTGWIRCLYINVINRLCVATGQSINDRREHMLRLDTSQLAPIRVPIVH